MRQPDVGLHLERLPDLALRRDGRLPWFSATTPSALRAAAIFGSTASAACSSVRRGRPLAAIDHDLRDLVMDLRVLRIELEEPAESDQRLVVSSQLAVGVRHVDDRFLVVGLQRERALEIADRRFLPAGAAGHVPEREPGVDDLRILLRGPPPAWSIAAAISFSSLAEIAGAW